MGCGKDERESPSTAVGRQSSHSVICAETLPLKDDDPKRLT